jgi:hypothetical protein
MKPGGGTVNRSAHESAARPSLTDRRRGAPWKHRPVYRAFLRLSPKARELAHCRFAEHDSTTAIARAIAADLGERIAVSSLNRYREWWDVSRRF